jgi:3-hydroxyacyl-CoA dehydrogenase
MKYRISKVAVLGSGVMGTGIACHLANIGLEVIMLDIVPRDLPETQAKDQTARNAVAAGALKAALKSKPAPLYDNDFARRITIGNLEDDLDQVADCDWIIEVIIERLDIKQQLFEKVEAHRKAGTLITSNTSGIPIGQLAAGRSDDFQKHFCGTHFFNPARYMRLFEVIPHEGTDASVVDFWMSYGDTYLGKKTVLCKDTPAFIANRIGFYSGNKVHELTAKYNLTIEEVDKLTGSAIGWPNTGSYRLLDLVGLDTSVKVTKGVIDNAPEDEYVQVMANRDTPSHVQFLLDNNFLGDKTGHGYYKKTTERDENGKRVILALDLETLAYRPQTKPRTESLGIAKKVEVMDKRINAIIEASDNGGQFLKEFFLGLFAYAANRIPEISDTIYAIDDAMKAGYAWGYGPFEYWDMIGIEHAKEMAIEAGEAIPTWVEEMIDAGHESFYKVEQGQRMYYDVTTQTYLVIPGTESVISLAKLRDNTPVFKNSETIIHDLGDGVLCVEFTTKSNMIGEGVGEGILEAIRIAETGDWKGIVIGNDDKNFSVGANLMGVAMTVMAGDKEKLEQLVDGFQQVNMAIRYSKIPVVAATRGYVFGGGVEILVHCDAACVAAESYLGLVEVGVGLLPGGGGTKEYALRTSQSWGPGDVKIPTLVEKLKAIATANVATSGHMGYNNGVLEHDRDEIIINSDHILTRAKAKVLDLAVAYTPPVPQKATVLGRGGLATLYTAINEFRLGNYMSDYDVEIARKVAYVLCGGDLTQEQEVSEQYLLDLERKGFLELLANQKTVDRIQHMLTTRKPLRN